MFYEYLNDNNMRDILEPKSFKFPTFSTESKVYGYLDDIILNNRKVLIEGDYDVDGITCGLVISDYLKALGSRNHEIFRYKSRTHSIDRYAMFQAIQGNYDYFIIGDTGSSDMEVIERVVQMGIKIIILDHHQSIYGYDDFPEEVAIINTTFENLLLKKDVYQLSAGALCYCVMAKYAKQNGIELKSEIAHALVSLYADSVDMSNELNRGIYWEAVQFERSELPICLQHFMNDYTVFGRRYIDYWYAPRINALFRSENLNLINLYFFEDLDTVGRSSVIEEIENTYVNIRDMIDKVSDVVKVEELKNYVFCNLRCVDDFMSIEDNKLYNYTGLIANKLSSRYKKVAIVLCETVKCYKGSVRDLYGRDYLHTFMQFCKAGGHNPAFGFTLPLLEYSRFLATLRRLDLHGYQYKTCSTQQIIEECDDLEPDSTLIEDMGLYNDFVGGSMPTAYIRKQYIGNIKQQYSQYYYCYAWGPYRIQSNYTLDFGTMMLLKPVKRKNVTLMV